LPLILILLVRVGHSCPTPLILILILPVTLIFDPPRTAYACTAVEERRFHRRVKADTQ
jgi:hypothetical protein